MAHEEVATLVIDNGSGVFKAGFAGTAEPAASFPAVVGRPAAAPDATDAFVGRDAQAKRDVLEMRHPVERGVIRNWEDMEKVWNHMFEEELHVAPSAQRVLLTEPALNPPDNRERMTQIMFETFGVPALTVSSQAVLSLYAAGLDTGCVLESGDGVTHVVAVHNGAVQAHATQRLDVAGCDVTALLARLLAKSGHSFAASAAGLESVRDIKEKLACVALDVDDGARAEAQRYELADGTVISLGDELAQCAEAMFKPALVEKERNGVHQAVHAAITKCDESMREGLYANVVLGGGNTMLRGMGARLTKELAALAPEAKVTVAAAPTQQCSAWVGGGLAASMPSLTDRWISKAEYEESGASIVHRKCT